ncbi:hypothetical protein KQX54_004244 [Cotesia glomerata]|uniref:Uncharacterized protein n=1 Tax=Cotesia glomerata TaxID=32391 RepID=A0AAV7IZA6_COTGL|nr:hypothetical protein KQX54_004244 [Cotesia glomerata]
MPKFFNRCCNPMNRDIHNKTKSLRSLPEYLAIHFHLPTDDRVCSPCHKELLKQYADNLTEDTDDESNESLEADENSNDEIIHVDESPDTFASTPSSSGQELLIQQSSSSLSEMSLSIRVKY